MKKIITLFVRGDNHLVENKVHPDALWVVNGEGVATRKWDGTCCLVKNQKLFKRQTIESKDKMPEDFIIEQTPDHIQKNWIGWVEVKNIPEDVYFLEAIKKNGIPDDGTYELCGPKINGNPENFDNYYFLKHSESVLENVPRDFNELKSYFLGKNIEGIVWHHSDGRMVKIKKKDFGLKRNE